MCENKYTTYLKLWGTEKAFLRGKYIALSAHTKIYRKVILATHMKALENKKKLFPQSSRTEEIIKLSD